MTGKVVGPFDLTSMSRVSETAGLVSKTPFMKARLAAELD